MVLILLILCGLLTGLLSGLLGIGGGVISVPALYFLFSYLGLFEGQVMQVAAATSLAVSLVISLYSAIAQYLRGAVLFFALRLLVPGLVIGCVFGALLGHVVSSELIRRIFGVGALLLGVYFSIPRLPHFVIAPSPNRALSFIGVVIGGCSSLLGIGGGILTFPTLLAFGMSAKASSATSSCTTTLSSLLGTVAYLVIAWKNPQLPDTFGYIYIHAFWVIGLTALLTTQIGVRLSHTVDVHVIKRIFGICLSIVGLTMIGIFNP